MRKVPGVLVTSNGISVAGNSGVRILINGKTTEYMDTESLLRDLPADNIAKVEVVEQPGAEHDASGSGAIINIILKKNVRLGTHGSVTSWIGKDEGLEYGISASIASYKNKLNWQASIGHSRPTWRDDLDLIRNVEDTIYDQTTISPYKPKNVYGSGNLDYFINDKNSFGVGLNWRNRKLDAIGLSTNKIIKPTESNRILTETSSNSDKKNYTINPYYEYKSDTEKLTIDYNYINYKVNTTTNIIDIESTLQDPNAKLRYFQNGKYNINTFRADYAKNVSDHLKLSFGAKYSMVRSDNDLASLSDNNIGIYQPNINGSSRFLIDENIFAVYAKANTEIGKWSLSGGLRYEDSNTKGTSKFMKGGKPTTAVKERPISKLFPSLSVSRNISENLGLNVSYSYRIRRPAYKSLNAFQQFLDRYSGEEGNPELKPAFTNKYQLNLTFKGHPFFTAGYSQSTDAIFRQIKQDNSTAQIRQKVVNIEDFTNLNFRLFAPLSIAHKKLGGYTGVILTNPHYKSKKHGLNIEKWNLYWFIQANYKLPWNVDFQLSGNYGTGALEGQIEIDWIAELDFSFSKKFMDDKLKTSLGFGKMLNRGYIGKIDYGNGNATVDSNGSRQSIKFKITYNFGSKFGKEKSKRKGNDEEDRIKDNN